MEHVVKVEGFEGFGKNVEIAGSYGMGINKSLFINVKFEEGEFKTNFGVKDNNRNMLWEISDIQTAINIYNEI